MTNIRIHRNENLLYPRYHNTWFAYFAEYCRRFFQVDYVNYWTDVNDHVNQNIKVILQQPLVSIGNCFTLSDVDMIIENLDTNEISVISFTEYFNSVTVHYMRSEYFKSMVLSHFNYHHIYYWIKRDHLLHKMHLVRPGIFPLYLDFDIDYYRNLRDSSELNQELFYKGSLYSSYRRVVELLADQNKITLDHVKFEEYLRILSQSDMALSYYLDLDKYQGPWDHPGEFCYRDMEYMAIGVPFVRIEYRDSVYNGLYPNHHYVSINRETAYQVYKDLGDAGVADLLYNKYLEVRNDREFLKFVSNNQRQYYDSYCRLEKSSELVFQQLKLQDWI